MRAWLERLFLALVWLPACLPTATSAQLLATGDVGDTSAVL